MDSRILDAKLMHFPTGTPAEDYCWVFITKLEEDGFAPDKEWGVL